MRRYQITVEGRTFDVRLLSDPQQEQVQVEVDGEMLVVEIETVAPEDTTAPATPAGLAAPTAGSDPSRVAQKDGTSNRVVAAPLPGVIKSIAVKPEQAVSVGDELLVIEAMKMDNVIRATRPGVVQAVLVVEGHHTVHGQPMVQYHEEQL
jgi:biotin carboxyl carrier protein